MLEVAEAYLLKLEFLCFPALPLPGHGADQGVWKTSPLGYWLGRGLG
jgi:hypothetical protein